MLAPGGHDMRQAVPHLGQPAVGDRQPQMAWRRAGRFRRARGHRRRARGEPSAVLSWRRKKTAVARSRGKTASACSGGRVPERNAARTAESSIGATGIMPAILDNRPKSRSPVQEAEGTGEEFFVADSGGIVPPESAATGLGVRGVGWVRLRMRNLRMGFCGTIPQNPSFGSRIRPVLGQAGTASAERT